MKLTNLLPSGWQFVTKKPFLRPARHLMCCVNSHADLRLYARRMNIDEKALLAAIKRHKLSGKWEAVYKNDKVNAMFGELFQGEPVLLLSRLTGSKRVFNFDALERYKQGDFNDDVMFVAIPAEIYAAASSQTIADILALQVGMKTLDSGHAIWKLNKRIFKALSEFQEDFHFSSVC